MKTIASLICASLMLSPAAAQNFTRFKVNENVSARTETFGCKSPDDLLVVMKLMVAKDEAALQKFGFMAGKTGRCQVFDAGTTGVVDKVASEYAACVRFKGEYECVWVFTIQIARG